MWGAGGPSAAILDSIRSLFCHRHTTLSFYFIFRPSSTVQGFHEDLSVFSMLRGVARLSHLLLLSAMQLARDEKSSNEAIAICSRLIKVFKPTWLAIVSRYLTQLLENNRSLFGVPSRTSVDDEFPSEHSTVGRHINLSPWHVTKVQVRW